MPVCNYDGEVIGVAQIINKRGGCNNHEFTETDLKVTITAGWIAKSCILYFVSLANSSSIQCSFQIFQVFKRYLTFCGIGIQNAQLFEVSILEYKKNQVNCCPLISMYS